MANDPKPSEQATTRDVKIHDEIKGPYEVMPEEAPPARTREDIPKGPYEVQTREDIPKGPYEVQTREDLPKGPYNVPMADEPEIIKGPYETEG
jgi:hypothetical protein